MKKKMLGMFVCMLLIATLVPMAITADETFGRTITVDDDGGADYTRIQDAIDNASDGDTVFVYAGTYYENIVVNKSIILEGEDKNKTVIDGHENDDGESGIIHIKADGVMVQGFTIQNSSLKHRNELEFHFGIEIVSDNNIIRDNIIVDNFYGLQIGSVIPTVHSTNNIIENNIIKFNINIGISINFANDNEITGNLIYMNGDHGIYSYYDCCDNLISYNNISSHRYSGIYVKGHNNMIKSNNIINHNTGLFILYSTNNQILENNIYNNHKNAEIHIGLLGLSRHMWSNKWNGNYWGTTHILSKMIIGKFHYDYYNDIFRIPLISFDWHPAQEPYDIL